MPLVKITRDGLCVIGCLVGILWGYLAAGRVIMSRATEERAAVLRTIELRRQRPPVRPAHTPRGPFSRPARPVAC